MKTFSSGLIRIATFFSLSLLFVLGFLSCDNDDDDQIELVFTSWRIDDVEEMNRINELYTNEHPDVTIRFDSYDPMEYDAVTLSNLSKGKGADIIFLWSYDKGEALYDAGYLYDLTNIIPNRSSYDQMSLGAWTTDGGVTYGAPSVGVTHGVYYLKSFFTKYNIQEPSTWDEFIAACEKIYEGGETAIAQGATDGWPLSQIVFGGLGPNFYGGEPARQALMAGTAKLTDANFMEAFNAVNSLKKYLPVNFGTLSYEEARQVFMSEDAAMYIGGSWEISVFEEAGLNSSKIGWFAPPVKNAGDKVQYCFHVDAGIGVNKNSKHLQEALDYLKWVCGTEYASALMTELPGFFSYTPGNLTLNNPLAQEMYNTASTSDLTIRLMFEKLNSQTPGGDALLGDALKGMLKSTYTPAAAAAWVQDQLESYYN
jgi:raffinose/stachyose/melibiose transport system substrate-binding protein